MAILTNVVNKPNVEGLREVSLPWNEEKTDLKDNHKQAENRLFSLERTTYQDADKAKCYREAISEYFVDGVAEEVPYEQISPRGGCPVFYLQHHVVAREDKFNEVSTGEHEINIRLEAAKCKFAELENLLTNSNSKHVWYFTTPT